MAQVVSQTLLDLFKKYQLIQKKIAEKKQRVYATAPVPNVQKIELARLKKLQKQEDVIMTKIKVEDNKMRAKWKKEHKGKIGGKK